jgi:hypothetical protein
MIRELPVDELENSRIPIEKDLKQDSISNEDIPNDSIKIGF